MFINKVEVSGVNTSKLPVLSRNEKEELLVKIKEGDEEAREKFIGGNLKLVLSVIGLIKAIDNFDITQNVQFSTYAVPMNV